MKQRIARILLAASILLSPVFSMGVAAAAPTGACKAGNSSTGQILDGIDKTGNCDDSGVNHIVHTIVEIFSWVIGIAAILMVLNAGFKYITSGGESGKVGNAKSTLTYAMVGLFIAALAQILVHFVLFHANGG